MLPSKTSYLALLLTVFMMSSAQAGIVTLNAQSAGYDAAIPPGYARLNVDGVDVLGGLSTRGINVAVIDQTTGGVISTSAYDTHGFAVEANQFAAFISGLDVGRIVMIGVQDEATIQFSGSAANAIASLGGSASNIWNGGYRGSYALIGVAGAGVGTRTAFEAIATRFASPVSVTTTITVSVPAPLSALILLSGLGILCLNRSKRV